MITIKEISHEYRHLVEDSLNDQYQSLLEKLYDWQEDYSSYVTWDDFKRNYWKCDRCGSYDNQQCICYAR